MTAQEALSRPADRNRKFTCVSLIGYSCSGSADKNRFLWVEEPATDAVCSLCLRTRHFYGYGKYGIRVQVPSSSRAGGLTILPRDQGCFYLGFLPGAGLATAA